MPQPLLDLWNTIQTYHSLVPWLILLFLAWLILRNRLDFSSVSPRLKRLKLGPTGFEIELFELQKAAEKAAAEVASAQTQTAPGTAGATDDAEPPSQVVTHERAAPMTAAISVSDSAIISSVETVDIERLGPRDHDVVETVLQEFTVDPKVALMRLSTAIERELTRLLAGAGFLAGRTFLPIPNAVDIIRKQYRVLPEAVLSALEAFWKVRNEIVHQGEGDRDDVLRVVDSGLSVFKTLRGMPKTKYVVSHPGVSVYADADGNDERPGVKAVIFEKISSGGLVRTKHVLPTTRTHFREGMEVAWEWNKKAVWGESWYLDPDTGKIEYAWTESMEFVGRDLDRLMLRSDMPAEQ